MPHDLRQLFEKIMGNSYSLSCFMYCLVLQIPESVKINASFVNNSVTVR